MQFRLCVTELLFAIHKSNKGVLRRCRRMVAIEKHAD